MKIGEIQNGASDVSIEGTVVEVGEPREVRTRFGPKRVADAIIEDDTGRIKLSLWEDNIDKVKQGQKITLAGCYVTEWNGTLQLNMTRQATMELE